MRLPLEAEEEEEELELSSSGLLTVCCPEVVVLLSDGKVNGFVLAGVDFLGVVDFFGVDSFVGWSAIFRGGGGGI